jgi:predicted component of type VI protein secretion system
MARLIVTSPEFLGQGCDLPDGRFPVGRAQRNMVIVSDSSVSSDHCELMVNGNEVIVRDCGSRNGTFVNGHRVQSQAQVKHGQSLRLGSVDLRLELEGQLETQSFTSVTAFSALKAASRELPSAAQKNQFPVTFAPFAADDSVGQTMMVSKPAARPSSPVEPDELDPVAEPSAKPAANLKARGQAAGSRGSRGIFAAVAVAVLLAIIWYLVR